MDQTPHNRKLLFCIVFLLAIMAYSYSSHTQKLRIEREQREAQEEIREQNIALALQNTPVQAKAVSVFNITNGKKLFGRNDEVPMPLASLTKILTIVTALNEHGLEEVVTISPEAIKQSGDSGLMAHQEWTIGDLSKLTLISSSNDGAYALWEKSDKNFIDQMNAKAKRLGARHTQFINTSGLDITDTVSKKVTGGAFGSAEDVNILASYAILAYPQIFDVTTKPEIHLTSVDGTQHTFLNTDTIVEKIPNIIMSKTGYTVVAGGNLTVVFKNKMGEKIAITLLDSTFEGRFEDMEKLVNVLYNL